MSDLPVFRVNLLRAGYALLVIGLGLQIWPQIVNPAVEWELQRSVVVSMLGAMGLLAVLGLRHPLKMLPLLFFEVAWKVIWTARVALPTYVAGRFDAASTAVFVNCTVVVLVVAVMPWDYIISHYILARGEPWRRNRAIPAATPAE